VDDDAATLQALQAVLEDDGYAVTCAADAPAALEYAEREPPDLILLDLGMPIMDGRGFAAHYQQTPGPHAPIVLVSAKQQLIDDVEQTAAAGFVRKPFRIDELLDLVRRFTAAHDVARERLEAGVKANPNAADGRVAKRPVLAPARRATTRADGAREAAARRKPAREQLEQQRRLRHLQRLRTEVADLRRQLGEVNEQTRGLLAIQEARPLSTSEAQIARDLSRESERLRWELQRLFQDFEQVRSGTGSGSTSV